MSTPIEKRPRGPASRPASRCQPEQPPTLKNGRHYYGFTSRPSLEATTLLGIRLEAQPRGRPRGTTAEASGPRIFVWPGLPTQSRWGGPFAGTVPAFIDTVRTDTTIRHTSILLNMHIYSIDSTTQTATHADAASPGRRQWQHGHVCTQCAASRAHSVPPGQGSTPFQAATAAQRARLRPWHHAMCNGRAGQWQARAEKVARWLNDNCNLASLCRKFPDRLQDLLDREGDRLVRN